MRKFITCKKCESATLATFVNPASGLCKVCDAQRLATAVYIAPERELLHDTEDSAADLGLENELMVDQEAGLWYTVDADGERIIVEETLTAEQQAISAKRARRTDAQADAWLAAEEARIEANRQAFAEWAAWYCRLKETTDAAQFLANKIREANYVELRDLKDGFQLASARQTAALVKLGWDAHDVRNMKLTVAEASRLLQRGPRWTWI